MMMIDKVLITNKLENFFKRTNPESFVKIFIISFLFDKVNYIEKVVGTENCLSMLDKYIYNLEQNLRAFKRLEHYHSIYAQYDFASKTIKYYTVNRYAKLKNVTLAKEKQKEFIIKEFKTMMYKELDRIINLYTYNGKIVSNGFYIEDQKGRYVEYEGDFSNIMDIFSDVEVCNMTNLNDKIKTYVDKNKNYYVYTKHISQRNSEVIGYVDLWRKFFDDTLFYFSINNPKKYSETLIQDFNSKYSYIMQDKFLLKNRDVFSLIENYLLHIKNRIDLENNVTYHQELSQIFKKMNEKKKIHQFSQYVLHNVSS